MKKIFSLLGLFLFTSIYSCGDSGSGSLEVYLSTDKTYADSNSSIDVEVKVFWDGKPYSKSSKVEFETELGSFSLDKEEPKKSVQTSASVAKATLYAPGKPGLSKLKIIVNVTGNTKLDYEAKIEFETVRSSMSEFNFSCDQRNFGALEKPNDAQLNCDAVLFADSSRQNKSFQANIEFLTELGSMAIEKPRNRNESAKYTFSIASKKLNDVEPLTNLNEASVNDQGITKNPRDGLVTLVAYTDGSEKYTDLNGNNKFDQDDLFEDLPEPWVDANDNDQWDSGEQFLDLNGNKQHDMANGVFDRSTKIFKVFKVLVTGPIDTDRSKFAREKDESTSFDLNAGSSEQLRVLIRDEYLNPIASASNSSDRITFNVRGIGSIIGNEVSTSSDIKLNNYFPFTFDEKPWGDGKVVEISSDKAGSFQVIYKIDNNQAPSDDTETILSAKVKATPYERAQSREYPLGTIIVKTAGEKLP